MWGRASSLLVGWQPRPNHHVRAFITEREEGAQYALPAKTGRRKRPHRRLILWRYPGFHARGSKRAKRPSGCQTHAARGQPSPASVRNDPVAKSHDPELWSDTDPDLSNRFIGGRVRECERHALAVLQAAPHTLDERAASLWSKDRRNTGDLGNARVSRGEAHAFRVGQQPPSQPYHAVRQLWVWVEQLHAAQATGRAPATLCLLSAPFLVRSFLEGLVQPTDGEHCIGVQIPFARFRQLSADTGGKLRR